MQAEHEHVGLVVAGARAGAKQPVLVESLGNDVYRIVHTPGLVDGVAAGDVVRVTDTELGLFEVTSRGGNVAVKVSSAQPLGSAVAKVSAWLANSGGRLDGAIANAAVWTVPAVAGFHNIEAALKDALAERPDVTWWYGNVYDESGEPLRWWESIPLPNAEDLVRAQWAWLRRRVEVDHPKLVELIEVASSLPKIKTLFPFLSIGRFCLSRCTNFPYYVDYLVSVQRNDYVAEVTLGGGGWVYTKEVGRGSAREAAGFIEAAIPADYGPARYGDAGLHFPSGDDA